MKERYVGKLYCEQPFRENVRCKMRNVRGERDLWFLLEITKCHGDLQVTVSNVFRDLPFSPVFVQLLFEFNIMWADQNGQESFSPNKGSKRNFWKAN